MGYILDDCPQIHECCWCIPLRAGAVAVGVIGMLWAAVFVFGFTAYGMDLAVEKGLPTNSIKYVRYFNGISGVLLTTVHIVLLFAAVYESDSLCEVYMWFMVCYWAALAAAGVAVGALAAARGSVVLACAAPAAVVIAILVSFYFVLVVANYRMTLP